jgi:hypothetical protein
MSDEARSTGLGAEQLACRQGEANASMSGARRQYGAHASGEHPARARAGGWGVHERAEAEHAQAERGGTLAARAGCLSRSARGARPAFGRAGGISSFLRLLLEQYIPMLITFFFTEHQYWLNYCWNAVETCWKLCWNGIECCQNITDFHVKFEI